MKKFRIRILTLVALFAVSSFAFAGIVSAKAEDTHTEAYNATVKQIETLDFCMSGAAVRKSTYPGIRFEVSINEAQWDAILAKSGSYNKGDGDCRIDETGLVMVPSDYLKEGEELTVQVGGSILFPLHADKKGGVYKLRGGLSPIDSELYDKKFTARGYIKYTIADNGGETANNFRYAATAVDGTDMSSRSLNEVSAAALSDAEGGLNDAEKRFVESIQNRTPLAPAQSVYNVGDTIDLGALNAAATSFFVSIKGGEDQQLESGSYTFGQCGRHKFKLQEESGISDSFIVDAVSEGHELDAVSVDDMYANCSYGPYRYFTTVVQNDTKVDTYDIGGINERMFAYSGKKIEKSMIFGMPSYSKQYYENLLDDYRTGHMRAFVDFSYYFENTAKAMSSFATVTNNTGYEGEGCFLPYDGSFKAKDKWVTESMSLEKFIGMYDDLYKGYVWEKNSKRDASVAHETYLNDNVDYLLSVYHYSNADPPAFDNIYIRDMKIRTETEVLDIGTVLVNRTETAEVDFSGEIAEYGYDSLELVSRYGNKTIPFADNKFTVVNDPESESYMEDGLYYLKGIKDGAEAFRLTFDIYDGTKQVEVESFGHGDSKDALKFCYISKRYKMAAAMNTSYVPAEIIEFDFDDAEEYGLSLGKAKLVSGGGNNCLDFDNCVKIYGDLETLEIPYLAIDESKFTNVFPMNADGAVAWHAADDYGSAFANLFVYVLPRHSREYYELYRDTCGKQAFAYASGMDTVKWGNGQYVRFVTGFDGDTGLVIKNGQPWDDYAYAHMDGVTIDEFIAHYDDFASGKIWTYELVEPGYEAVIKTARLYSVTFMPKEAPAE